MRRASYFARTALGAPVAAPFLTPSNAVLYRWQLAQQPAVPGSARLAKPLMQPAKIETRPQSTASLHTETLSRQQHGSALNQPISNLRNEVSEHRLAGFGEATVSQVTYKTAVDRSARAPVNADLPVPSIREQPNAPEGERPALSQANRNLKAARSELWPEQVKGRSTAQMVQPETCDSQQQHAPRSGRDLQPPTQETRDHLDVPSADRNPSLKPSFMVPESAGTPVGANTDVSPRRSSERGLQQDENSRHEELSERLWTARKENRTSERAPRLLLPKAPPRPRPSAVQNDASAADGVHIAKVDIHIQAPPPQPQPPARVTAAPITGLLARGFTSSFGLRQG
jgi:hypothetical protein